MLSSIILSLWILIHKADELIEARYKSLKTLSTIVEYQLVTKAPDKKPDELSPWEIHLTLVITYNRIVQAS